MVAPRPHAGLAASCHTPITNMTGQVPTPQKWPTTSPYYAIAPKPQAGDEIGIVSYGRDRANAASLQEVCKVIERQSGVILMDCDITFGSSGSPVFSMADGHPQIVSVVSAMADVEGRQISIGTSLQEPLAQLLASFNSQSTGSARKIVTNGQRNDTGAKFLRP